MGHTVDALDILFVDMDIVPVKQNRETFFLSVVLSAWKNKYIFGNVRCWPLSMNRIESKCNARAVQ